MFDTNERDNPGMHTTATVDFDMVLSGEVWLELDGGAERMLRAGDCVIQNGTRHAWHNRSDAPCVMLVVLLGAELDS
jgi:quercetin dioxygenase-like cupin family protein